MFFHQWIAFGKGQGLSLYYQKVVIKFEKILKTIKVYFLV